MVQMRLKNSLTSNTTLYRKANGRVRYYRLKECLTLFGGFTSCYENYIYAKTKRGYNTSLKGDVT